MDMTGKTSKGSGMRVSFPDKGHERVFPEIQAVPIPAKQQSGPMEFLQGRIPSGGKDFRGDRFVMI